MITELELVLQVIQNKSKEDITYQEEILDQELLWRHMTDIIMQATGLSEKEIQQL